MSELARTHTCGALRAADMGGEATLLGWVHRVRDLGSLIFIDVRDRFGVTQVVARDDEALLAQAKRLRPEFVVALSGTVERRSDETLNPKIATGEVEVAVRDILVLSEAKRPPFQISDASAVSEDIRLKYRYLDLRSERMQRNMQLRHRVVMAARRALSGARTCPPGLRLCESRWHDHSSRVSEGFSRASLRNRWSNSLGCTRIACSGAFAPILKSPAGSRLATATTRIGSRGIDSDTPPGVAAAAGFSGLGVGSVGEPTPNEIPPRTMPPSFLSSLLTVAGA